MHMIENDQLKTLRPMLQACPSSVSNIYRPITSYPFVNGEPSKWNTI